MHDVGAAHLGYGNPSWLTRTIKTLTFADAPTYALDLAFQRIGTDYENNTHSVLNVYQPSFFPALTYAFEWKIISRHIKGQ